MDPHINAGIILDIVEVESEFFLYDYKTRCYDYVIYWISTEKVETLPDIIIEKFSEAQRRISERLR